MMATDTGHFYELKMTGSLKRRKEMIIQLIYVSDEGNEGKEEIKTAKTEKRIY